MSSGAQEIIDYYTETGHDYEVWSKRFNMHFGYYRSGMDPFDLEQMLDEMNGEVLRLLELDRSSPQVVLDMGCGLGATGRYAVNAMQNISVYGVTIVPWQIKRAIELTETMAAGNRLFFTAADYSATPFASDTFDGIYALESACYAPGLNKHMLLKEAYRTLKNGKRLVVADAFLKTTRQMGPLTRACYRAICSKWALKTLGNINYFTSCLEELGFTDIRVRNISRNVAPSVLHIPAATFKLLIHQLFSLRGKISARRFGNAVACILLLMFVLDRTRSGYFMVSCSKGKPTGK